MLHRALVYTALVVARGVGAQELTPFDTLKARALFDRSLPCLGCHALGGIGGRIGPDLATVHQRRSARYIVEMIDDPQRVVPGSAMPRTPLTTSTRALLVRYLARGSVALTPRAVAPPRAAPSQAADVVHGATLYARWCTSCHGAQGGGDGPNAQYLPVRPAVHRDAALLSRRSDDQLFDAIAAGGFAMGLSPRMPAFGATLAPPEVRALVAHLRTLCQCRAPAWATPPHVAPPPR